MIFVYPAAISENVDKRYLPGIVKTLELYFLHHIVDSISSGTIRFAIDQSAITGKFSDIKLEAFDFDCDLGPNTVQLCESLLLEATDQEIQNAKIRADELYDYTEEITSSLKQVYGKMHGETDSDEIRKLDLQIKNLEAQYRSASNMYQRANSDYRELIKQRDSSEHASELDELSRKRQKEDEESKRKYDLTRDQVKQRYDDWVRRNQNATEEEREHRRREYESAQRQIDREERAKEWDRQKEDERAEERSSAGAGGVTRLNIDTTAITDLRPTAVVVEVPVTLRRREKFKFSADPKETPRSMPIGVKVIPIVIKNFDSVYDTFITDIYASSYSTAYRGILRSFSSKLINILGPIGKLFASLGKSKEDFDLWRDMLSSSKGFVDASSFSAKYRSPGHQKYAASIMVLSHNDIRGKERNFFDDPNKVSKLFKLGWNSFAVANDPEQKLTFCSYFDNGLCTQIPYSYLFHALKASDLFKELDSLGKFTTRIIGKFVKKPKAVLGESFEVRSEVNNKITSTFSKYLEVANGSNRTRTRNRSKS